MSDRGTLQIAAEVVLPQPEPGVQHPGRRVLPIHLEPHRPGTDLRTGLEQPGHQPAAEAPSALGVVDPHPVDAAAISDAATAEAGRTADLEAQLAAVTGQVSDLQAALAEAGAAVDADAADATATRSQLARATTKLGTVQAQLRAAQARLAALDRAAAHQAALNRAAARQAALNRATSGTGAATAGGGGEPREADDGR